MAYNIYNSARLEGINITYQDTKTILKGVNVPTLKLDEIKLTEYYNTGNKDKITEFLYYKCMG